MAVQASQIWKQPAKECSRCRQARRSQLKIAHSLVCVVGKVKVAVSVLANPLEDAALKRACLGAVHLFCKLSIQEGGACTLGVGSSWTATKGRNEQPVGEDLQLQMQSTSAAIWHACKVADRAVGQ